MYKFHLHVMGIGRQGTVHNFQFSNIGHTQWNQCFNGQRTKTGLVEVLIVQLILKCGKLLSILNLI